MFCINCGNKISVPANFCPICGVDLNVYKPAPKPESQPMTQQAIAGQAMPREAPDNKPQDDIFEELFRNEHGYWDDNPDQDRDNETKHYDGENARHYRDEDGEPYRGDGARRRQSENARRYRDDDMDRYDDEDEPRRGKKSSPLPAVLAIVAIVLAFLLFIGPKFLGINLLPFDLFGTTSGESDDIDEDIDDPADGQNSDISRIESIVLYLVEDDGRLESIATDSPGAETSGEIEVRIGDYINLTAMIEPAEVERLLDTGWSLTDAAYGYFVDTGAFDAVFAATAPGETVIEFIVYDNVTDGKDDVKVLLKVLIEQPSAADGDPPFKGDILVNKMTNSGIYIRSDHVVNGESNKLNDGNKIGWIAAGDKSVQLTATGRKWQEDDGAHLWYEVEIPKSYRDTAKQTENYAGKPLVGWVRSDLVQLKN